MRDSGGETADTVDFVIVGGGSAGCVLARRLSEDGRNSVLLLEAGGSDRHPWIELPIGYGRCFFDPEVNWRFETEPEPALAGRRGYWPRGRVLGGSSAINAMVFIRGQPRDFDEWRDHGNAGWGFSDVLPYFKRLEASAFGPSAARGANGPVHLTHPVGEVHPLCRAFLAAARERGIAMVDDLNEPATNGVGIYEITASDGRRMSAARAYLRKAPRGTLQIALRAEVETLIVESGRVVGVRYRRNGRRTEVRARREIVLAAGAIGSPMILLRSGIGPPEALRSLAIPVVHAMPAVGQHMQDHLCIDYIFRTRVPTLNQVLGPWRGRIGAALTYARRRGGPLSLSVNQAGGFIATRGDGTAPPDMQLYFTPASYVRAEPGRRALLRPDAFPGVLLSAQPCRPQSRGRIALASPDPAAPPRIEPGSLSHPADLEALLEGARLLRTLAAAPSLAAVIDAEIAPGEKANSREALIADIRARASTVFHPVGTCRMGPDPATSVVDSRLRVHGLLGLRVIDASIFPTITSGNTNAPVMMVAEKGADLIKADAA